MEETNRFVEGGTLLWGNSQCPIKSAQLIVATGPPYWLVKWSSDEYSSYSTEDFSKGYVPNATSSQLEATTTKAQWCFIHQKADGTLDMVYYGGKIYNNGTFKSLKVHHNKETGDTIFMAAVDVIDIEENQKRTKFKGHDRIAGI